MTAGQWVDRALNAALIAAGSAANRIMATAWPSEAERVAAILAEAEAEADDDFAEPLGEYPEVPPFVPAGGDAGAPLTAPPLPAGTPHVGVTGHGGDPNQSTSDLLKDVALELASLGFMAGYPEPPDWLNRLIAAVQDRAANLAACGD